MSTAQRVSRDFHRLALFLAAIPLLLGGSLSVYIAFDYRAAVRDLTPVVRRYLSRHHRSKPELCPYLEGHRGTLFGSGSVLALRGLQRQIQRRGPPDDDPICGRARGGPVCKLDPRWSTRTGAIDLFGDGVRGCSGRVLGLQASRAMTDRVFVSSRAQCRSAPSITQGERGGCESDGRGAAPCQSAGALVLTSHSQSPSVMSINPVE